MWAHNVGGFLAKKTSVTANLRSDERDALNRLAAMAEEEEITV